MWSSAEIVVPVVIGALGSVPKDLEKCLNLIGLEKWTISVLQKTMLLNTCRILRHYTLPLLISVCMYICYFCPNTWLVLGCCTRLPFIL